ncbi:MAG: hypothetical protein QNJ36_19325 [Calothrix sp. MO_167.B42]|nr:hypothetical protein [Calothrix sp. MO_167.B42]
MKAIEVRGSVDDKGQLSLDKPLTLAKYSRVRVIILVSEDDEDDDELTESASESFRQGWYDAMTGNTMSVSQLWS